MKLLCTNYGLVFLVAFAVFTVVADTISSRIRPFFHGDSLLANIVAVIGGLLFYYVSFAVLLKARIANSTVKRVYYSDTRGKKDK
jgi:hypothetical protein